MAIPTQNPIADSNLDHNKNLYKNTVDKLKKKETVNKLRSYFSKDVQFYDLRKLRR